MEAALSAISQAHVRSDIAFAVAKKALDAMRQEGQGSLALLESAAKLQQQAVDRVTTSGSGSTIQPIRQPVMQ